MFAMCIFLVCVCVCVTNSTLIFFLHSWGCLILMATGSSACRRWRGELVFSFVCLGERLSPSMLTRRSLFLLFDRRLLPVHENFLLKFEVRLLRLIFSIKTFRLQSCSGDVQLYWIDYKRIICHQSGACTYGRQHKCDCSLVKPVRI